MSTAPARTSPYTPPSSTPPLGERDRRALRAPRCRRRSPARSHPRVRHPGWLGNNVAFAPALSRLSPGTCRARSGSRPREGARGARAGARCHDSLGRSRAASCRTPRSVRSPGWRRRRPKDALAIGRLRRERVWLAGLIPRRRRGTRQSGNAPCAGTRRRVTIGPWPRRGR